MTDPKAAVKPAQQELKPDFTVTDSLNRVIRLKKPGPLAKLDFLKAAGAGAEGINSLYLSNIVHLQFVAEIDGQVVATPSDDAELRALYARLGDEGNEAVMEGVVKFFSNNKEAQESELKNS